MLSYRSLSDLLELLVINNLYLTNCQDPINKAVAFEFDGMFAPFIIFPLLVT